MIATYLGSSSNSEEARETDQGEQGHEGCRVEEGQRGNEGLFHAGPCQTLQSLWLLF